MAAPSGTNSTRWSELVDSLAGTLALSTSDTDTWLNAVWAPPLSDEVAGNAEAHAALKAFLAANTTDEPTLPVALQGWLA